MANKRTYKTSGRLSITHSYVLVGDSDRGMCEQLTQSYYIKVNCQKSNLWLINRESEALTMPPVCHVLVILQTVK